MGIQINGATDSITAIDGTIDVVSAIGNAGVVTATAFVGNITGNVTGNINHASNLELQTGGVTRAHFNSSGHFGVAGISTFSNDVKFTGNNYNVLWDKSDNSLKFDALAKIKLNDSFQFYHNTNGVIHNTAGITFIYGSGSGNISIQAQSGAQNISCSPNGGTSLYYQGSQKLYTVSDGIYVNDNLGIQDSIQHILDTNTKIRFPANDTISFETAGDERLRIASNGKVGINQSSNIQTRLHVSENIADSTAVNWGNSTISLSSVVGGNSTNNRSTLYFAPYNSSNQYCPSAISVTSGVNYQSTLKFFTNGNGNGTGHLEAYERLRIDSSGNILTSGNIQLFGSNTSDGSDNKAIMINGGGAVSDSRGGYLLVHGNEHSSNPGITRLHAGNVGTAYIAFNTGGNERLRITSAGFVQIGAAANAAEAPLHVTAENSQGINAIFGAKDFVVHDNYNYADANIALQGRDADDNDTGAGIQFTVRNTGNTNWLHGAITMDQSGNYIFKNGGAGTTVGTEKLSIASNGKVKIGGGGASLALLHIAPTLYGINLQNDSNNKSRILFSKNSAGNDSRSWIEGNGELNGYIGLAAGDSERVRIQSGGLKMNGGSYIVECSEGGGGTTNNNTKVMDQRRWMWYGASSSTHTVARVAKASSGQPGDGDSKLAAWIVTYTARTMYGFNSDGGYSVMKMRTGRFDYDDDTVRFSTEQDTLGTGGGSQNPTIVFTDEGSGVVRISITNPSSTHSFGEINLMTYDCRITLPTG